jgi:hypothetical protein
MHRTEKIIRVPLITAAIFLFLITTTASQTSFQIKRTQVNWPNIELHVRPQCNGINQWYNLTKDNFTLLENAIPVDNLTVTSPDSAAVCPLSIALVFDGGSTMKSSELPFVKGGGRAFISALDSTMDETAIILAQHAPVVLQNLTQDKPALSAALEGLSVGDSAVALYDAVWTALQELALNGKNPCRALLVVSSDSDRASSKNLQDVITFAQQKDIRIYAISVGLKNEAYNALYSLSLQTGGDCWSFLVSAPLETICTDVARIGKNSFEECVLMYTSSCADGTLRTVSLTAEYYCPGSDRKTFVIRVPRDTTSFSYTGIRLGTAVATGDTNVFLPLELVTPLHNELFSKANFTVLYDMASLEYKAVATPPGTLLESVPITGSSVPGGMSFQITKAKMITGSGMLAALSFKTKSGTDTIRSQLALTDWNFGAGCLNPLLNDGSITIIPKSQTAVEALADEPQVRLCGNYPNPVHAASAGSVDATTIGFELSARMRVRLVVYDLFGRQLAELVNDELAPGKHSAVFDAGGLPNGMYIYRIETPHSSTSMMLAVAR